MPEDPQDDPFKKYGGQQVTQTEDPFKKYGGQSINQTEQKKSLDGGGLSSLLQGYRSASEAPLSSPNVVTLTPKEQAIVDKGNKILQPSPIDATDPLKSINNQLLGNTIQFKPTSSESMDQQSLQPNIERLKQQNIPTDKMLPREAKQVSDYVTNNIFKNSKDAQNWLNNNEQNIKPDNETAKVAQEKVVRKQNFDKLWEGSQNIYDMAAKTFGQKDFQSLNPVVQGRIMDKFLNTSEANEKFNQDHNFHQQYLEARGNLYSKFPQYAIQKIATNISQKLEDQHMTGWLYSNPDEKTVDKAVEMLKQDGEFTPQDELMYQKFIRPVIESGGGNKILKTTDLLHSIGRGLYQGATNIESSLRDITNKATGGAFQKMGLLETDEDRSKRLLNEELSKTEVTPKGELRQITSGGGEFLGFTAPMILGEWAKVPSMLNATLMFEGNNADKARELFPEDKGKQNLYTLLSTGIDASLMKLLPIKDAKSGLQNVFENDIKQTIDKLATNKITQDEAKTALSDKVFSYLNSFGKKGIETSNVLSGFQLAHNTLDAAFGKRDFNVENELNEAISNYKTNFLSGVFLSGIGALKDIPKSGKILLDLAENKDAYDKIISDNPNNESPEAITEKRNNLQLLSNINDELKQRGIDNPKQREQYLGLKVKEELLNNKIKNIPDKKLQEQHKAEVEKTELQKEAVLSGQNPDEVKTDDEIKLERLQKDKELDDKEFATKRKELDGRTPEDRPKIERLEEDKKRSDEDFEREQAKLQPKEAIPTPTVSSEGDKVVEDVKEIKKYELAEKEKNAEKERPNEALSVSEKERLNENARIQDLEHNEATLSESQKQTLQILRSKRDKYLRELDKEFQSISSRYGGETNPETFNRQDKQQWELLQRKLQMGDPTGTSEQSKKYSKANISGERGNTIRTNENIGNATSNITSEDIRQENINRKGGQSPIGKENKTDLQRANDVNTGMGKENRNLQERFGEKIEEGNVPETSIGTSNSGKHTSQLEVKELAKTDVSEEVPTAEKGTGEPPTEPPTEPPINEIVKGDESKISGITHADTAEIRDKLGLPEYQRSEPNTHEKLIADAKQAISDNPSIANEVMDKYKDGGKMTPEDNAILSEYKAALDYQLENNPSKEIFDKINDLIKVLEPAGTEAGKLLESRKLLSAKEDNLSNFLLDKQMSQGTALTESQIKTESQKYNELKKAKEELEAQLIKEREQHAKDIAELGFNKAKAKARKEAKKTDAEYKAERKKSVEDARKALKEIRDRGLQSTIPGIQELKVIAPHVKDFLNSLASQGIDKLDNAVNQIYAEFKDVLNGIKKTDIIDIIGGQYDTEKKLTRNEKAAALRLIEREAKLIKELSDARKGIESSKNEAKKTQLNRRVDELKEKIKEVRKLNKERDIDEAPNDKTIGEKEANAKLEKQLFQKAQKLKEDLKNKRYLEEKEVPKPFAKSRKTILLQDKVMDLENKIRHERMKDEYNKRSKWRKAFDKVMEVLGIRRIVQSAVDMSIPFRQGATLLSPRKIGVWVKAFQANLKSVFSPKKYDRIMYEIRHDEDYHNMLKDNIVFNEMNAADPELHNEDFKKSFIYKIPVVKEPLLASNRSADAFLNVARYEMYKNGKKRLEKQGLTRESDPEAYKRLGNWVMNMTGRGKMIKAIENGEAHVVLGNTFYGARLMASRFNLLNPLTYFDPRIPKEVRYESMKDMISFTATIVGTGLALQVAGFKISLNPWDSDFLQLRHGDKVYDISGGLANYIRTGLRMVDAGYTKITGTKYEGREATEKAGKSLLQFFRNKLAPNTSFATDAFFGKANGQDFDPSDVYRIYPMYTDDVVKAVKEDGMMAMLTVLLPNILGVGYGSYPTKGQIDPDLDTLLERNMRTDELDKSKIKNYNEGGREINNTEFKEYIDKRDAEIKKGITTLFKEGADIIDKNDEIIHLSYKNLSREQVVAETSRIKSAATKKVKEELFGKEEKSDSRKQSEKDLKVLRGEEADGQENSNDNQ